MPELKRLEEEFPIESGVVVIGVHSAKFDNEKDSRNIDSAAQRYNISHPVVNDRNFLMWNQLNVYCWPTLLVLGPNANPLFVLVGEEQSQLLIKYVRASINFYADKIRTHSISMQLSSKAVKLQPLKFPAKVTRSADGKKMAVSDSGHNRVLVMTMSGDVIHTVGGKNLGFENGSFSEAKFDSPQGLCFHNNDTVIYVADTENHAIRKIDLERQTVETVIGNGKQGSDYRGDKLAHLQTISSPWDVKVWSREAGDCLLIAMAGTHQIWGYFLDDLPGWRNIAWTEGRCMAIAGSGHEANRNNAYPANAAFSQPSGLTIHEGRQEVFIADSESSTIRRICLADGKVQAVVGGDRNPQNLFAFGDVDGKNVEAKLQHPLDVAYNAQDQLIYVADTYNHKVKRIDPNTCTVETLSVKDRQGNEHLFNEPGGICADASGDLLIVANTNNHSLECIDLKSMVVDEIRVEANIRPDNISTKFDRKIILGNIIAETKGRLRIRFQLQLPDDTHFTDEAPQTCKVAFGSRQVDKQNITNGLVELDINMPEDSDISVINFDFKLSLCTNEVCFPSSFAVQLPIEFNAAPELCTTERTVVIAVDKAKINVL